MNKNRLSLKNFVAVSLIVSVWVHLAEASRFFLIVTPIMEKEIPQLPLVTEISLSTWISWAIWDTLLSSMYVWMTWLTIQVYGKSLKYGIFAGVISWVFFFLLFWIAMLNMNLASLKVVLIALPLALVETIIASCFAVFIFSRQEKLMNPA
ncbi:MAG: hypothetical protein AABZ60_14350 [Planctomycetota bacterium]